MRQKNWGVGHAPRATRRSSHQTLFFLYVRVQRFESLEILALCREFAAFSARLQALRQTASNLCPLGTSGGARKRYWGIDFRGVYKGSLLLINSQAQKPTQYGLTFVAENFLSAKFACTLDTCAFKTLTQTPFFRFFSTWARSRVA